MEDVMEGMTRETYALTKARLDEHLSIGAAHLRWHYRMVELACRLAQLAHEDGVEMVVESPDPKDDVVQIYVLWSHESLVLSVYVQALRQALADLCGR